MRHAIVHQRPCHELTILVVDGALKQRLPDALRDAAVYLPFDDHRIDDGSEIVDRGPVDDFGLAGLAIDFDLANMTAGGEGENGRIVDAGLLYPGHDLLPYQFVRDVDVERNGSTI